MFHRPLPLLHLQPDRRVPVRAQVTLAALEVRLPEDQDQDLSPGRSQGHYQGRKIEGERGIAVTPAPAILAAVAVVTIPTLRGQDPALIPARAPGHVLTLDLQRRPGDVLTPVA